MPTKYEMLKGLDALEDLIKEQARLGKDGLIFIFEQGLWKRFMEYHAKEHIERRKGSGRLTLKDVPPPQEANMI